MSENSVPYDTVMKVCRDQHRRIVLAVLAGEQRRLTVNDLTKAIVKNNHHASVSEMSAEIHSEIQLRLHHVHLPKMSAAGLVDYDRNRGLVEPTEQFEQMQPQLSALIEMDPDNESPIEL